MSPFHTHIDMTLPRRPHMSLLWGLLLGFLMVLAPGSRSAWASTYTLAVVPQFTAVDTGQRWTPLLEQLHKDTGIQLQIRTSTSIPAFETEFLGGVPDFVYLNPYHMVMAAKAQAYRPLVRSSQPLSGILVATQPGPKRVADLNGATLAFPAPNAFGASLYLRALLQEREKLSFTANYVGTHQNVYRHVLHGEAQAGGGIETTLEKEPEGIRKQLAVLYRTPDTAAHPLAVHPRVPGDVADKIVQALRRMAGSAAGRKLLQQVELDDAILADYRHDYAPLEALHLERYVVNSKK
jgi:phosphonate transport system substrate-binding protein